ncbi:MAG: hypothetical protein ACRDFB_05650, partial [Rhabdochlamydiaceae bacterium]
IPMCLADRKPSLLCRDSTGKHPLHLNLDMNQKRILISRLGQKQPPISFDEFLSQDNYFDEEFASLLKFSSRELNAYLRCVIEKHRLIDELYSSYKKVLQKSNDLKK